MCIALGMPHYTEIPKRGACVCGCSFLGLQLCYRSFAVGVTVFEFSRSMESSIFNFFDCVLNFSRSME